MNASVKFKIGVIVNPFAGIGGSVGLKGSDGQAVREEAFARGAEIKAPMRMRRCLEKLQPFSKQIQLFCFEDEMGESSVIAAGLEAEIVGCANANPSSATDTQAAVKKMLEHSVDIILFAGGDGTARVIADALAQNDANAQVVLGVPSGVKMHSSVYAITPEAAGEILLGLLQHQIIGVQPCDVRDIDEEAFRQGVVKTKYYASMNSPQSPQFLQQVKNSGAYQDELVKLDIAHYLIENIEQETLYIVGPGSTTHVFLTEYVGRGTLLGVDLVCNGQLICEDATSSQILDAVAAHSGTIKLIVTAIGGQGHIFGRGNQQLTPTLLKKIPRENIQVIATKEKILSLQQRPLLVDTNDAALDNTFIGYQSVLVGYDEYILYPIGNELSSKVE